MKNIDNKIADLLIEQDEIQSKLEKLFNQKLTLKEDAIDLISRELKSKIIKNVLDKIDQKTIKINKYKKSSEKIEVKIETLKKKKGLIVALEKDKNLVAKAKKAKS